MIYVIDHNDSFTHNVVHQFSLFDEVICDNYNEIRKSKLEEAKVIVLSPGPGNPKNYPITSKIYKKFKGKKKIIGICLGFQQILHCEGAEIETRMCRIRSLTLKPFPEAPPCPLFKS